MEELERVTEETEEVIPTEAEVQDEAEAKDEVELKDEAEAEIDYESLIESDLLELKGEFPELSEISDITELKNPLRYAALRDLGLTPKEAYLATGGGRKKADTRSHLSPAVSRSAGGRSSVMTRRELENARELFDGLSDLEISRLYRRVTG